MLHWQANVHEGDSKVGFKPNGQKHMQLIEWEIVNYPETDLKFLFVTSIQID